MALGNPVNFCLGAKCSALESGRPTDLNHLLNQPCASAALCYETPCVNTLRFEGESPSCATSSGVEAVQFHIVPPGATITITPEATFALHETRWGSDATNECPGLNIVRCATAGDTSGHTWTNDQASSQTFYVIVHADGQVTTGASCMYVS